MSAGRGGDVVHAMGGGRDAVDRGPGHDIAEVDRGHTVRACELLRR